MSKFCFLWKNRTPYLQLHFAVANRPTVGWLGHVLADRQSVVQADGQPTPAQRQVAGKISVLMHQ